MGIKCKCYWSLCYTAGVNGEWNKPCSPKEYCDLDGYCMADQCYRGKTLLNGYQFKYEFGCMSNETMGNTSDIFTDTVGVCQSHKLTFEDSVLLHLFEICDDGDLCNEKPLACAGYVSRKDHALLNLLASTLIAIMIYHLYQ
ncbi:hypothetical protein Ddc_15433 [Ditylenchus destructor]|nr:hypothetical protein Ddc_15433 [Ditylenchus destructor]